MPAEAKSIILITGANSGIGFELAAQLLDDASKHVLLGCRSKEKGQKALGNFKARNKPGSVELLLVDVSDENSIKAAARTVQEQHGRLDALVNNAAIATKVEGTLPERMVQLYETNVIGPYLMGAHFLPLLRKSTGTPRIINVGSRSGSITHHLKDNPEDMDNLGIPYRASKAALNMVTADQTVKFGKAYGFKIFSYTPGFSISNLTAANIAEYKAKPTSEGAAPMVAILTGARDADSGKFISEDGVCDW